MKVLFFSKFKFLNSFILLIFIIIISISLNKKNFFFYNNLGILVIIKLKIIK